MYAASQTQTHALPPPWSLSDFEIMSKIGEGRFGKIYLAKEIRTQFLVAIKCLAKDAILAHDLKHQVQREVEIQSFCRHKNITRLYAYFWDDQRIFLVLEYANGGDLYGLMKRSGSHLPEPTVARLAYGIALGLSYLHEQGFIHRDIKPDNILLHNGRVKICDFTWVVSCSGDQRRQTLCGTLDYLSPEVVSSAPYDASIDDWCLGVVLYELLCGHPPFDGQPPAQTCLSIRQGSYEPLPPSVSTEASDCITRLLSVDANKRLRSGDVLTHPWIVRHCQDAIELERTAAASVREAAAPRDEVSRFLDMEDRNEEAAVSAVTSTSRTTGNDTMVTPSVSCVMANITSCETPGD